MKFEDYLGAFEGDFFAEARRMLGDRVRTYSRLQEAIGRYSTSHYREEHLRTVQEFYRIGISTGIRILTTKVDPHSGWVAGEVKSRIEGQRVVDVGCCDGLFTVFYALNHPEAKFIGIDVSEEALDAARKRSADYAVKNAKWVRGDVLDKTLERELEGGDTIILQDVLYQLFGSGDRLKERKMLRLLSSHQRHGSVVIIAEEGEDIKRKFPDNKIDGYTLEAHHSKTKFDRNARAWIPYEVAVFRRDMP